jgi:hypothetical protein
MECNYTHLNHNSVLSKKKKKNKSGHPRCDYKGGLIYIYSGLYYYY